MPKISVIVPVYKVEGYLRRCVESILSQSFASFDLILVDDGSPDNCGEMCDTYAQADQRVHVIHHMNQGLAQARNAGIEWAIKNSDSEWITFIDSDDWIHKDYLKALFETAINYGVDLSICNCIKTAGFNVPEKIAEGRVKLFSAEDFWCFRQYGGAWAKLYRKSHFRDIRYPKGLLYEDIYVTYRLVFMQTAVAYIQDPLYFYYIRNDSITKSRWTPGVLAQLTGMKHQIYFFSKNKYLKALRVTIRNYILDIKGQIEAVRPYKKNYTKYYILLHAMYRIELARYCKFLPINQYIYIYRYGFPLMTKIYKKFTYLNQG